jgi:ankyrin repeat protein
VNAKDFQGHTPLHAAIIQVEKDHSQAKSLKTIKRLVQNGAKLTTEDQKLMTPIHFLSLIKDKDLAFLV